MRAAAAVALVTLLGPSGRASVVKAGLLAGALLGLVSLGARGAYFAGLYPKDELPALGQLIAMCSGWITFTSLFGLVAGLVSRRTASDAPRAASDWLPRMGGIALVATLMVLAAGGVVTAAAAGMAVPDWPGTFGANMFLYPLSKMTGGVYFEHAHRLLGQRPVSDFVGNQNSIGYHHFLKVKRLNNRGSRLNFFDCSLSGANRNRIANADGPFQ